MRPIPAGRRALTIAMLAGMAFASNADAQGSVTLYGVLDTSIEVTNPGGGWVARMDSGAYRGSRIGLRGAEPVGGGTSILFDLESGFSTADGSLSTAGTLFNRQAWIGAGGPWGQVRVGRQYSPIYIPFKGQIDAFGAGTIASGLNNFSKITPYVSNAVTYLMPTLAGFDATVMIVLRSPDENDGSGLDGDIETVSYRYGPLRIAYARQHMHGSAGLDSSIGGVTYDFGRLTAFADWFTGDGGTPLYHSDGIATSFRYAFTRRFSASLGYAYERDRTGAGNDADQFSAMCEYDVSKALQFYASAGWLRNRNEATFTLRGVNVTGLPPTWPGAPVRGVQIGMLDRF